jgi:hypothetical protein
MLARKDSTDVVLLGSSRTPEHRFTGFHDFPVGFLNLENTDLQVDGLGFRGRSDLGSVPCWVGVASWRSPPGAQVLVKLRESLDPASSFHRMMVTRWGRQKFGDAGDCV